jgi:hypothetical protein
MSLSLNILPLQRDSGTLVPFLARLAAGGAVTVLVQDEFKLAVRLRRLGYGVIYRSYRPDDARLHETMTPQAFVDAHRHMALEGIVVQCLNEPVVSSEAECARLSAWLAETMRLASAAGMRLCVGNFAMGNPHERWIEGGALDPILRNLGNHILGLHEYAMRGEVQLSWLVGRYKRWLARASAIGVQRPNIVLSEAGFDIGGGHNDGWRAHISAAGYADLLRVMAAVYAQDDVTACVFSWGDGFSWGAFNIEGEAEIMAAMVEANGVQKPSAPVQPSPPAPLPNGEYTWERGDRVAIVPGAGGTNVRATFSTSAAVVTRLIARTEGEVVAVQTVGAFRWGQVKLPNATGWIRADAATWEALTPRPPRPQGEGEENGQTPTPGVFVALPETAFGTREEALRHAAALEGYARAIRAQVEDKGSGTDAKNGVAFSAS